VSRSLSWTVPQSLQLPAHFGGLVASVTFTVQRPRDFGARGFKVLVDGFD
jgi:hypothetical protein